jgi:hypothetical protein
VLLGSIIVQIFKAWEGGIGGWLETMREAIAF